ncbi:MAG: TolC family protein [Bradyrhizobiaceae bacterium]|nr:TolC family protein [Bradyrhizobiaceae bacterium]
MRALSKAVLLCLLLLPMPSIAQVEGGKANTYTLEECIRIALGQNLDLQLSDAYARNAAAGLTAAFGSYLPSASINANYSRQLTNLRQQLSFVNGIPVVGDPLPNSYSMSASASWLVFNGFRREAQYDAAQSSVNAASFDVRSQRMMVAYRVTRAYLEVLRTEQLVHVQEENLALSRALLERIQALYDGGRAPVTQVLSQETEVANQETAVVQARNTNEAAKVELLVLMNVDPTTAANFDPSSFPSDVQEQSVKEFRTLIGSEQESVQRAMGSRPDISAARYRLQVAESGVTSATAGYYPTLIASGGYSWSNFELSGFDKQSRTFVGLSLSVPVFDQFSTNRNIEQAKLQQTQSNIEYSKLEQSIQQNIRRAYLQLTSAEKGLEIANRALKPARTSYDAMQERYNVGSATLVEVQQTNAQLVTARINRVTAMYAWLDAQAYVQFATGLFREP